MNLTLSIVRLLPISASWALFGAVAEAQVPADASGIVHEYIENAEARVLKVYSIQDGDHRSQNYVIEWKGQEVVVSDRTHMLRSVRLGQAMHIQVRTQPYPHGRYPHGLLSFSIMAPKAPVDTAPSPRKTIAEVLEIPGNNHGTFTTPVRRVYSANDGPHLFRAYVFEWKGEEAIAFDNLVHTNYKAGEMMTVMYMRSLRSDLPEHVHGELYFLVMPERSQRRGGSRR